MAKRLQLEFADAVALREEYERNLRTGGAFVPTDTCFELRAVLEVELCLVWCGERFVREAEVVQCISADTSGVQTAGVAVHFLGDARDVRDHLERFLEPGPEPEPEVQSSPAPDPVLDLGGDLFGDEDLGDSAQAGAESAPVEEEEPLLDDADLAEALSGEPADASLERPAHAPLDQPPGQTIAFDPSEWDPESLPVESSPPEETPTAADEAATPSKEDPLAQVSDRRAAPRAPARVPALVQTSHASVAGRTRDLSETGVLISADASELPIGKAVRLQLTNPVTGVPLEVAGTVARHVETDGTVAAVGVRFEEGEVTPEEIAAFVQAAKRSEADRSVASISGTIAELGMANILQMLGQSEGGTLTATSGNEEGVIAFQKGMIRYARLGSLRGSKALARLLSWENGSFTFHSQVDELDDEDAPAPLDAAILEAIRQLDEANRAEQKAVTPATVFAVDREAMQREAGFTKTEEAVLDLATAAFTVRRILDVIPEPDAEIWNAIGSLEDRHILIRPD